MSLVVVSAIFVSASAAAHVSIASGPALGNVSQEVTFAIAHGCDKVPGPGMADTVKLVIDIPTGVTSVRAMPNPFGKATVTASSVTYEKAPADYLSEDVGYYKFTVRLKPPNNPFTKVYFKAHQYCNGVAEPTEWVQVPGESDAGAEPAAELAVLPDRKPGWNKYTVPVNLTAKDLESFFKDAQVVWKGNAGYSFNPNTLAQIKAEPGATELTALSANDEIWVKY
jgi:uncharacterized protein YcnI